MTLIEQFPDVSMQIREKRKLDSQNKIGDLLKHFEYNPVTYDQKFYDKEFRIWHFKVLAFLGLSCTALFYLLLNGKIIFNWIAS
jgi:hypothetical protein